MHFRYPESNYPRGTQLLIRVKPWQAHNLSRINLEKETNSTSSWLFVQMVFLRKYSTLLFTPFWYVEHAYWHWWRKYKEKEMFGSLHTVIMPSFLSTWWSNSLPYLKHNTRYEWIYHMLSAVSCVFSLYSFHSNGLSSFRKACKSHENWHGTFSFREKQWKLRVGNVTSSSIWNFFVSTIFPKENQFSHANSNQWA